MQVIARVKYDMKMSSVIAVVRWVLINCTLYTHNSCCSDSEEKNNLVVIEEKH